MRRQKRVLMVTDQAFYQLSLKLSVLVRIPISKITAITLTKQGAALLVIHVQGEQDFIMETLRRTELVIFIINLVDNQRLKRPKIHYSTSLKIVRDQGAQEVIEFDVSRADLTKGNRQFLSRTQANNFINAQMVGYLDKRSDSIFRTWTEKFCILTNVGLLYYNDATKRPRNLFPVIDSKMININENVRNLGVKG